MSTETDGGKVSKHRVSEDGFPLFLEISEELLERFCIWHQPLDSKFAEFEESVNEPIEEYADSFFDEPPREDEPAYLVVCIDRNAKRETVNFSAHPSILWMRPDELALGSTFNYLAGLDWMEVRTSFLACVFSNQPELRHLFEPGCRSIPEKVKQDVRRKLERIRDHEQKLVEFLEQNKPLEGDAIDILRSTEVATLKLNLYGRKSTPPGKADPEGVSEFCRRIDDILKTIDLLKKIASDGSGMLRDSSAQEEAIRLNLGSGFESFESLQANPSVKAIFAAASNATRIAYCFNFPTVSCWDGVPVDFALPYEGLCSESPGNNSVKIVRAGVIDSLCDAYDGGEKEMLELLPCVTGYIAMSEAEIPLTNAERTRISGCRTLSEQLKRDELDIALNPTCEAVRNLIAFKPPVSRSFRYIADALAVMAIDAQKADPTLKLKVCKRCGRVFLGANRAVYCDRPIEGSFGDDGERETCRSASAKERLRGKTVSGGSTLKHALNELSKRLSDKSKYVADDVANNVLSQSARGQVSAHVEEDTILAYKSIEYWYMRRVINKFLYEQVAELGFYEAETCSAEITDWARSATSGPGRKETRNSIIEAYEMAASRAVDGWMAVSGIEIGIEDGSLSFSHFEHKYETLDKYAERNGAQDASSQEGVVLWFQERYGNDENAGDPFKDRYAFQSGIWLSWDYNLDADEPEPLADIGRYARERSESARSRLFGGMPREQSGIERHQTARPDALGARGRESL